MIIPDFEIRERCERDDLVYPYIEENIQPASIDVTLGNKFLVFERDATPCIDMNDPADITKAVEISDKDYFLLHPGEFVLGVTKEQVQMPNDLVARIEGKSSIGRLGLLVHITAGFVDPGFNGCVTLEMAGLHPLPIKLRPGKLIAQLAFEMIGIPVRLEASGPIFMQPCSVDNPYNGRYQGDLNVVASRYGK